MTRTYILIPVFNEESVIGGVIKNIKKIGYKNIIVIDDGSNDKTSSISEKAGALVLRHSINRGKGAAIKTGIQAAKQLNADVIVTIDGDGQHKPQDISRLLNMIRKYDVVLGSRSDKKEIPFFRKVAHFIANFFISILFGLYVSDSQSGLRAYSKKAFEKIDTLHDRYEFDSEVIREIARHKLTYTEVPIHTIYTEYSLHKSTRQTVKSSISTFIKMFITS